ncbi:MAG: carboxypeptidase-like regulatory domain-containing protein, partial [bacterium]
RAAVKSTYGSRADSGSIDGRILNNQQGSLVAAAHAHVWVEDAGTGRVMASGVTNTNGTFNISGIVPGYYRVMTDYLDASAIEDESLSLDQERRSIGPGFRAVEIASQLRVSVNKTANVNYVLVPPQNSPATLTPRFVGVNSELSTVSVHATPGAKLTVYVSGDGVEQVSGTGLLVSSPYLTVNPASLTAHQFANAIPVISFDVTIGLDAPAGDYSIRLQSNSGEIAYLVGALTVEPKQ